MASRTSPSSVSDFLPAAPARRLDHLPLAALVADPAMEQALEAVVHVLRHAGVSVELDAVTTPSMRAGTVGRIGVPQPVVRGAHRAGAMLAPTVGLDPLAPMGRLWRGLVRRCGAELDIRLMQTMPGSAAALAGHERDLVLVSQRPQGDGTVVRDDIDGWGRARRTAEVSYRLAMAQEREVVLVTPPGRLTQQGRLLADACEREARTHRQPAPRLVKAGMLSAMVAAPSSARKLLLVTAMPLDDLTTAVTGTIGELGPWPVLSVGDGAEFIAIALPPSSTPALVDPTGAMLAVALLLQRRGSTVGDALLQALRLTCAAECRMRMDAGTRLPVSAQAFAQAVIANWGREEPGQLSTSAQGPAGPVDGLVIRVQTTDDAGAVREAVGDVVEGFGLEVTSVRPTEVDDAPAEGFVDVRVRVALGEPSLDDALVELLVRRLGARWQRLVVLPAISPTAAVPMPPADANRLIFRGDPRYAITGRLARRPGAGVS